MLSCILQESFVYVISQSSFNTRVIEGNSISILRGSILNLITNEYMTSRLRKPLYCTQGQSLTTDSRLANGVDKGSQFLAQRSVHEALVKRLFPKSIAT